MPASLHVLDEEILAGPMRLIIKTADETIDTAKVGTPVIAIGDAGIKATISGKARGKNLIVEVEGEGDLEFDGFAYLKFSFKPIDKNRPVSIENIMFEVPFKKKYAELYDDSNYGFFATQSGRIPAEGMELAGTGAARVGDTYRGVQFWPLFGTIGKRTTAKPLTFTPTAESMIMRYVISEGVTLDTPLTVEVGIIGTPVKPYDAKRIRMTGHAAGTVDAELAKKGYASTYYWFSTWTNFGDGSG